MKEVIDRFVQLTVVQCDLCDRNSETNRMSRCYGCRRDICQKHTNFEDLDNNDYIVALCSMCIASFRVMNIKRIEIDNVADEEKERIEKEWRQNVVETRKALEQLADGLEVLG